MKPGHPQLYLTRELASYFSYFWKEAVCVELASWMKDIKKAWIRFERLRKPSFDWKFPDWWYKGMELVGTLSTIVILEKWQTSNIQSQIPFCILWRTNNMYWEELAQICRLCCILIEKIRKGPVPIKYWLVWFKKLLLTRMKKNPWRHTRIISYAIIQTPCTINNTISYICIYIYM